MHHIKQIHFKGVRQMQMQTILRLLPYLIIGGMGVGIKIYQMFEAASDLYFSDGVSY
jgi:hypothetical protein